MDDSLCAWMLLLYTVIVYVTVVNSYRLKPVVLPQDMDNARIFTEMELAQYDDSDVRLYVHFLFCFYDTSYSIITRCHVLRIAVFT